MNLFSNLPGDLPPLIFLADTLLQCISNMRTIRTVCREWKTICCECASLIDARMQERAQQVVKRLPYCFAANVEEIKCVSMDAWVKRGMARYRYECQRNWERAMQTGVAAEFAVAKDDADISSVIGTRSLLDFDQPQQCYNLFTSKRNAVRVEESEVVHVQLETAKLWFGRYGWKLDSCAALLFYAAAAERIDAGSSYMILSDAVQTVVECHECIETLGTFFVDHMRNGQEAALHRTLHHRFGVDWRVKLQVLFDSLKILHAYNMRTVSRDLLCLASRLFGKIQTLRASSQTIRAFSEKLNAGIPMVLLLQEACATA